MRKPFQFKNALIHQAFSAMPVTTHACLFTGIIMQETGFESALEIGSGTAFTSILLSKKYIQSHFTTIEIDEKECNNAKLNIDENKCTKINLIHSDFLLWNSNNKFDLIVSNPPFFNNQLRSINSDINRARHSDLLPFNLMLKHALNFAHSNTKMYFLLPLIHIKTMKESVKENNLFITNQIDIKHKENAPSEVFIWKLECVEKPMEHITLTIFNESNSYSNNAKFFLKDIYIRA